MAIWRLWDRTDVGRHADHWLHDSAIGRALLPILGAADRPVAEDAVGLDDLRRRVLHTCVVACAMTPIFLMLAFSTTYHTPPWLSSVTLGLYGVGLTTALATRRSAILGGWTLIAGLLLLVTGCIWTGELTSVAFALSLIVLFSSTFAGTRGGLLTALAATIVVASAVGGGRPLTDGDGLTVVLLAWGSVPIAYLATEPIRLALNWSWSEFQRAEREADRARRNQAELAQMVKSLNAVQDRLEAFVVELARARRAADEARRLKSEFAATISHELRTPLNLIIGFSEMMAASDDSYALQPLPPMYQRDVDTIYRNARHLSSLIDDILDLSQIDALRMGLFREAVRLSDLSREALDVVDPLFRRRGLSLSGSVPEDLPLLNVDRARVRQVLINLLNNAARFTDHGGVRLSAWKESSDVVIAVADTGAGIPPDEIATVFDEFRQVHGPLGRRAGGSGLGLTISKRIAELHGGTMWAESQPGEGSTFYFTLPVTENVVSVPLRREWETWADPPARSVDVRSTLVIWDDDGETARLLQRHLDAMNVAAAASAEDVYQVVAEESVAAVVLTGPDLDVARERAAVLRRELRGLPVVVCVLSGRRDIARELGVADYLVKPVLGDQVARSLLRLGLIEPKAGSGAADSGSRDSLDERAGDGTPREILVVDDDPDLVDLLVRMVRATSRDLRVRRAYGGAEGLAAMRERRPTAVFLDLLMAGKDGYAVLDEMRADDDLRDIPVIVVSARGKREEAVRATGIDLGRREGFTVGELTRVLTAITEVLKTS